MITPHPNHLEVTWRGRQVRVRHDDRLLTTLSQRAGQIRSSIELASTVHGIERFLVTGLGDRYAVRVRDDMDLMVVEPRRRT